MFDPERMLGQLITGALGGRASSDNPNSGLNAMGGLGGGWKLGAGLGVLGVALAAFDHFRGGSGASAQASSPPPPPPPPPGLPPRPASPQAITREVPLAPPPRSERQGNAMHLLRSMIAAAHADGQLDASERAAIVERAQEAGLPADDLMALGAEVQSPRTLDQLIAETPDNLRRETWAAAMLAIRLDQAAEQAHLERLATGLGLSAQDCSQIRQQLGL